MLRGRQRAGIAGALAAVVLVTGGAIFGGEWDLGRLELALTVVAFATCAAVGAASILYLRTRDPRSAAAATTAAKAGLVATTIALAVGCAHDRTRSGSWWVWEVGGGMLLLVWLMLIAYLLLRSSTEGAERAERFAAIFAAVATVDIPFLYLAVRWFVGRRNQLVDVSAPGVMLDAAGVTLLSGLFLSFLAGMFYLYGAEWSRTGGAAPASSHVSTE